MRCQPRFFGEPICDDKEFLKQSALYSITTHRRSQILATVPLRFRPLVGPILGFAIKRPLAICTRIARPLVEERLRLWNSAEENVVPDDALQGIIERCARAGPEYLDSTWITQSLLQLNVLSIYNTTYTLNNCILDIFGSDNKEDYIDGLRAECIRVVGRNQGQYTEEAIGKLYRLDSAIRESMRISAPFIMAFPRVVSPGQGLDLDNGIHIPPGVRIGVPQQAIHRDPSFYHNPLQFDPFRFSRQFEGPQSSHHQDTEQDLSVLANDTFLGWGYGKKACPARWYATTVMKQILAYILINYDIEMVGKRKQRSALLNMVLPETGSYLRARRRALV